MPNLFVSLMSSLTVVATFLFLFLSSGLLSGSEEDLNTFLGEVSRGVVWHPRLDVTFLIGGLMVVLEAALEYVLLTGFTIT